VIWSCRRCLRLRGLSEDHSPSSLRSIAGRMHASLFGMCSSPPGCCSSANQCVLRGAIVPLSLPIKIRLAVGHTERIN
jgi:hypothetical protein